MAKKSASQKAPAKKPLPAKKPATKKPVFMKKATPQEASASKKPMVAKTKPTAATPALKKTELAPVMKPVFEESVPKPAAPVVSAPSPKLVMKTGAGGATSLTISAQTSAGAAANGNTHPANILALVSSGGWPVTELTKDHFTLMEYFEVPGQQAPFSNNITSFRNVGTGAYLLQVKPINGAPWRTGHHLAQILVSSSDDRQGQCAAKLIIR